MKFDRELTWVHISWSHKTRTYRVAKRDKHKAPSLLYIHPLSLQDRGAFFLSLLSESTRQNVRKCEFGDGNIMVIEVL